MDTNNLIATLKLTEELRQGGQEFVDKLAMCYGQLGEAYLGSAGRGAITQNKNVYKYLFNPAIITYATYTYASGNMNGSKGKYPKLDAILNPESQTYIGKILKDIPEVTPEPEVKSYIDVAKAISTFGLTEATDVDAQEITDSDLVNKLESTGIFDSGIPEDDIFDDDVDKELAGYGDVTPTEPTPEQSSDQTSEQPASQTEEPTNQTEQPTSQTEEPEDTTPDDYSDLKKIWGEQLAPLVSGIMDAMKDLYSAGYALITPSGILTNVGIVKSKSNDKSVHTTGNPVTDIKLYNKIVEVTGNQFTKFTQHDEDFDIMTAMQTKQPVVFSDFHIRNIFGHFSFCTGKYSLRKYITDHKINNKSTTKMVKYSDMSGYIREHVENMFYRSYRKMGIGSEVTQGTMQLVDEINATVSRCIKNVIVVVERKPNVNTHLKICSDSALNIDSIMRTLQSGLNVGTAQTIVVKQVTPPKNGVYDINIIYNDKAYSQDALFAYQVTDTLLEQGIKPSWDNVVMGKSLDGNIMTYNFKTDQATTFGIYAGSRSGKGVMTLNLLASALADNCKVLYTDAKPEMASVLGQMAWKNGRDVFAFNGVELNAGVALESNGCIRQIDRFYDLGNIPETLFEDSYRRKTLALTIHYYRCLGLVSALASARANNVTMDDWIVAVFDECEQFAEQDKLVDGWLEDVLNTRKKLTGPDGKKLDITKDPACVFINKYRGWRDDIGTLFFKGIKSAFGLAHISIFFIWQSSKFPKAYVSSSPLAKVIEQSSGKIVKIIGRGAIEQGGSSNFGNGSTLGDMEWYDEKFKGDQGGYFGICTDIRKAKVFRPFNVYTDANQPDKIIMNAKASGLSENDLIGVSLNPDGTVIPEVGFEGYVTKLLSSYGISPAERLEEGFSYADAFIRQHGVSEDLLHYVYNVSDFTLISSYVSDDDSSDTGKYNIDIDGGDDIITDEPEQEAGGYQLPNEQASSFEEYQEEQYQSAQWQQPQQSQQPQQPTQEWQQPQQMSWETPDGGVVRNNEDMFNRGRAYQQQPPQFQQRRPVRQQQEISDDDLYGSSQRQSDWEDTYGVNPSPEEITNSGSRSFSQGTGADYGVTFFTSERTATILNLTDENSTVVRVRDHRPSAKSMKLMKFFKGAQYEFKSRWDSILNAVARKQNPDTITTVVIFNDALVFNNRQIACVGLLGGIDGVEVRDVVGFKALAKKFRNIRSLTIDNDIYESAILELGDYPETALFNLFRSLTTLSIWKPGCTERPRTYNRQTINSQAAHEEMQVENARARLKRGIDTIAASNNPRLGKTSFVNQARVVNAANSFRGSAWESCKSNFKNNNFIRGSLAGTFAIASGVIGLGLAGVFKLGNMFSRR